MKTTILILIAALNQCIWFDSAHGKDIELQKTKAKECVLEFPGFRVASILTPQENGSVILSMHESKSKLKQTFVIHAPTSKKSGLKATIHQGSKTYALSVSNDTLVCSYPGFSAKTAAVSNLKANEKYKSFVAIAVQVSMGIKLATDESVSLVVGGKTIIWKSGGKVFGPPAHNSVVVPKSR